MHKRKGLFAEYENFRIDNEKRQAWTAWRHALAKKRENYRKVRLNIQLILIVFDH